MHTKIYVGNLPGGTSGSAIQVLFEPFGIVYSVQLFDYTVRATAEVAMTAGAAAAAIRALNAKPYGEYLIRVHEALRNQVY
jgi:hypothetical protein